MQGLRQATIGIGAAFTACLFAGSTLFADTAVAQSADDQRERLRRLLERKLPSQAPAKAAPVSPRMRGAFPTSPRSAPARQPAPSSRPPEVIIIRPDGKLRRAPTRPAPNSRSRLVPRNKPLARHAAAETHSFSWHGIWQQLRTFGSPGDHRTSEPMPVIAGVNALPRSAGNGASVPRIRSFFDRIAQAQKPRRRSASPLGVVPDTYVVQFKYSASNDEIDAVLRKYRLQVVGGIPKLGIVFVRRPDFGRSRSALPGGGGQKSAEDVIEPVFLKRLRQEPGVNTATVHATISPKSIPRPSDATVRDAGRTYHWTWRPDVEDDGNWGLKRMRIPPVWRILENYRIRYGSEPVRMSFLDSGFSTHPHLSWRVVHGLKPGERLIAFDSTCLDAHGTHVAGIAGATHGLGKGIDGIVPNAKVDAIPLDGDGLIHGAAAGITNTDNQNFLLFTTALGQLIDYLDSEPVPEGGRRVINVSLGHNWRNGSLGSGTADSENFINGDLAKEKHRTFILAHAQILRQSLKRYEKDTLFVVAAGNDSQGLVPPLKAKWSSPFAYLGLENSDTFRAAPNVVVVEAADRTGGRAPFSNTGGDVAAPGVDIMSTIGGRRARYAICEGTSQAAPHVTALAAILMELAPEKSPAEIADIITAAALPHPDGTVAPRVDAFEAVLKAQPEALTLLADLNNDGTVDQDDLATYRRHRQAMTTVFMSTLGSYFLDLNDNGQIEDNEHWWPRIDLNGSGLANLDDKPKCLDGRPASDLDVIKQAWQGDERMSFKTAMKSLGLEPTEDADATVATIGEGNVMRRLSASRHREQPARPSQCTW